MSQFVAGQSIVYNKPKTKKKKNPKNAFSFYLDDAMKELRRQGNPVSSKAEAVPLVNEKWKNMSAAQKAFYETKAKEWKLQQKQAPKSGRLDCTGHLIDDRINMEDLIENQRKQAKKLIKNELPAGRGVCDVHFYFISFQSLFELPDEEGFQPCEVTCIDYTLNGGIEQVWHKFIDPGPIKLGLRAEIRIFSEKTHQIPEEGFEYASNHYHLIWNELLQFVQSYSSSSQLPLLFCKMSEMRKTQFCLDWLSANAGFSNRLNRVFEIEILVTVLYEHSGMMQPSLSVIEGGCSSHMYDFETDTSCSYHEELECVYCSMLTIKKCCYWISDTMSKIYGIEITDKHLPVKKVQSFVITKPDFVCNDDVVLPHKKNSNSPPNRYLHSNSIFSSASGDASHIARDIRYRPNYKIVPARIECTDFVPTTSLLGDKLHHYSERRLPSPESSIHSVNSPNHKNLLPTSSRLAANFQVKLKYEGKNETSQIDDLSENFDAASISSVTSSEMEYNRASRAVLGRGRGRARFHP